MKYCKRCLYPENHPYGLIFDENGVCSGCRIHEEKDKLDWDKRFKKLINVLSINLILKLYFLPYNTIKYFSYICDRHKFEMIETEIRMLQEDKDEKK